MLDRETGEIVDDQGRQAREQPQHKADAGRLPRRRF
jgi:hypothetical protein